MPVVTQTFRRSTGLYIAGRGVQVLTRNGSTVLVDGLTTDSAGSVVFTLDVGDYDYLIEGRRVPFTVTGGWVDLTSALTNGWTADSFKFRRAGQWVEARWTNLNGAVSTATMVAVLPVGFRSSADGGMAVLTGVSNSTGVATSHALQLQADVLTARGTRTTFAQRGSAVYFTDDE